MSRIDAWPLEDLPLDAREVWESFKKRANVTFESMQDRGRMGRQVRARHRLALELQENTTLSLTEIGAALGGRDHTTVTYALRQARERREDDDKLFGTYERQAQWNT